MVNRGANKRITYRLSEFLDYVIKTYSDDIAESFRAIANLSNRVSFTINLGSIGVKSLIRGEIVDVLDKKCEIFYQKEEVTEEVEDLPPISLEDYARHISMMYGSTDRLEMTIFLIYLHMLSHAMDLGEVILFVDEIVKSNVGDRRKYVRVLIDLLPGPMADLIGWLCSLVNAFGLKPREVLLAYERFVAEFPDLYTVGSVSVSEIFSRMADREIERYLHSSLISSESIGSTGNIADISDFYRIARGISFLARLLTSNIIMLRSHGVSLEYLGDTIKSDTKLEDGEVASALAEFASFIKMLRNISSKLGHLSVAHEKPRNCIEYFLVRLHQEFFEYFRRLIMFSRYLYDLIFQPGKIMYNPVTLLGGLLSHYFWTITLLFCLLWALQEERMDMYIESSRKIARRFISVLTRKAFLERYLRAREEIISPLDYYFASIFSSTLSSIVAYDAKTLYQMVLLAIDSTEKILKKSEESEKLDVVAFTKDFGEALMKLVGLMQILSVREAARYIVNGKTGYSDHREVYVNILNMCAKALKLIDDRKEEISGYPMEAKLATVVIHDVPFIVLTRTLPRLVNILSIIEPDLTRTGFEIMKRINNILAYICDNLEKGNIETAIRFAHIVTTIVLGGILALLRFLHVVMDVSLERPSVGNASPDIRTHTRKLFSYTMKLMWNFANDRWYRLGRVFLGVLWRMLNMVENAMSLYEDGYIDKYQLLDALNLVALQMFRASAHALSKYVHKACVLNRDIGLRVCDEGSILIPFIGGAWLIERFISQPISILAQIFLLKNHFPYRGKLNILILTSDFDNTLVYSEFSGEMLTSWIYLREKLISPKALESLDKILMRIRSRYINDCMIYPQYVYYSLKHMFEYIENKDIRFSEEISRIVEGFYHEDSVVITKTFPDVICDVLKKHLTHLVKEADAIVMYVVSGALEEFIRKYIDMALLERLRQHTVRGKLRYIMDIGYVYTINGAEVFLPENGILAVSMHGSGVPGGTSLTLKELISRYERSGIPVYSLDKSVVLDIIREVFSIVASVYIAHISESYEDFRLYLNKCCESFILVIPPAYGKRIDEGKISSEHKLLLEALKQIGKLDEYTQKCKEPITPEKFAYVFVPR